ncbi:hypothetical protein [Aliarcobacter cryaerophilus]|uniref:hypothetical protein n=1 Tax=Aliarcobacter cryaerophilus TaxID=28198 RepID=UPI0021B36A6B|nr:hypothetical protein [Aliarcobacter cryaerophilus]MCT7484056.1 hypothetical protein [Aliarcobacter cryaerophilus]
MTKYTRTSMINKDHIKKIHNELLKFGSKVKKSCLNKKYHSFANVMYLACSGGKFGLQKEQIEEIKKILKDSHNIDIDYSCEGSITGPKS